MVYKSRNIHSFYNESKYIAVAVYNLSCTTILIYPLNRMLADEFPTASMILKIISTNYVILFTTLVLFYHKVSIEEEEDKSSSFLQKFGLCDFAV